MMQTATVLIVDDSILDRRLIAGLLRNSPELRAEFAANGREALERVIFSAPDLVITDLVMPEMGGLELIQTMRERFPDIPVILMTAYGNESTIVEALHAGAASYVPKAQQAERLVETTQRILARVRAERTQQRLGQCLKQIDSVYSLDNDPALVVALVDQIQQTLAGVGLGDASERVRTCVALEEALLNAMYHGNLEITEQELARARASLRRENLAQLVEQRRGWPRCRARKIVVETHIAAEGARFIVRDEGPGFNAQDATSRRLAEYFEEGRNRGLMLMRSLTDLVQFNELGNEVTLVCGSGLKRQQSSLAAMK